MNHLNLQISLIPFYGFIQNAAQIEKCFDKISDIATNGYNQDTHQLSLSQLNASQKKDLIPELEGLNTRKTLQIVAYITSIIALAALGTFFTYCLTGAGVLSLSKTVIAQLFPSASKMIINTVSFALIISLAFIPVHQATGIYRNWHAVKLLQMPQNGLPTAKILVMLY